MPTNAPPAAKPTKSTFDPFNSSATGHQRAENRLGGSTSWRDSRNLKLREQFTAGAGGGKRVSDTVGAGSQNFGRDGRTENGGWMKGAKGLRTGGQQSLWESVKVEKKDEGVERPAKKAKVEESTKVVNPFTPFRKEDGAIRESSWTSPSDLLEPIDPVESSATKFTPIDTHQEEAAEENDSKPPQIFSTLTFYINGCTSQSGISDHKLKHLISTHGGNMSIALGRRTVTHVILGKPNSSGGVGGGLAGSKIQKEIASLRGKSVKFVTAEWVVESIKAGKRLPESKFEAVKLAPKGMKGINTMFQAK